MLKGTWGGRPVAVKRLLSDFTRLASQEVKLLQASDDHPNVIRCKFALTWMRHAMLTHRLLSRTPRQLPVYRPRPLSSFAGGFDRSARQAHGARRGSGSEKGSVASHGRTEASSRSKDYSSGYQASVSFSTQIYWRSSWSETSWFRKQRIARSGCSFPISG